MENKTVITQAEYGVNESLKHLEYLVRKTMRNRMSEEVVFDCMRQCLELIDELKLNLKENYNEHK